MWRDTLVWDDSLIWSDDDIIGEALTGKTDITPIVIPDVTGGLSDRLKVVEGKTVHNMQLGMTDTFLTGIDSGYLFEGIAANNKTAYTSQLSCGFTTDSDDIFTSHSFAPGATYVDVRKIFSFDSATELSINASQSGDTWNGAEIDFYFIFKKINQ